MKLALVTEFFRPTTGGTQTAVAHLAEALAGRGHAVTVFAPITGPPPPPQQAPYEVAYLARSSGSYAGYLGLHLRLRRRLGGFEAVHVFHPAFGLGALLATPGTDQRLVVSLMGYDTYAFAEMPPLKQYLTRRVCRGADALTAPSADLAARARAHGIERPIAVIPHGVAPVEDASGGVGAPREKLGIPGGRLVFVSIQRLEPVKDPGVVLDAWGRLGRADCHLVLVGGGSLLGDVQRGLAGSGLATVTLAGEVPPEEVPRYLALADAFIHHARYEAFGIGILEAMQAGLPVVAVNVGAVPELIEDGRNGLLVPPSDPVALAGALRRLADTPALREALGGAARVDARRYAWPVIAERYERLYRS